MNRADRALLIGMVLGDATIAAQPVRKDGSKGLACQFVVTHSAKQKEYIEHKAEMVRRMFGGNCVVRDRLSQGKYPSKTFTRAHKYFRVLRRLMYPGGKKTITRKVLNMLTPHGIALWYMDDGCARKNFNKEGWISSVGTHIATYCSEEEIDTIVLYFKEVHGIDVKKAFDPRRSHGNEWFARMNTENSRKFVAMITPFIIPQMLYKVSHVPSIGIHERQTPEKECKRCGKKFYEPPRKEGICGACYCKEYKSAKRAMR